MGTVARRLRSYGAIAVSRTQRTVLLVEDNEDNRIIYATFLAHAGYRVLEAVTGPDGVAKAREELPELILMDISVPGMDGWEATRILKADPATRDILIVALTAHALADDREKSFEVGCDGYLAKPIEPKGVLAEVERLLNAPRLPSAKTDETRVTK